MPNVRLHKILHTPKVMARGAKSFEHRHVLRERMAQQLTTDEMLQAIDEAWFDGALEHRRLLR